MSFELVIPETKKEDCDALTILGKAKALTITTHEENADASIMLRGIKSLQSAIVDKFKESKQAANDAHKKICKLEAEHVQPLKDAEAIIKRTMQSFMLAEEQKRRKEQERLVVEAEEKGELPEVVEKVDKPEGIALVETWSAEVIDLMALIKAVASGKAPMSFLLPNQAVLDQQARSLKGEFRAAGVKVQSKQIVSARKL